MKTCPVCKQEIPAHREICRDCMKAQKWQGWVEEKELQKLFPLRIVSFLDTFALKSKIKLNRKDIEGFSKGFGLFLCGAAGTGKTMYAAAILMELKRRSYMDYDGGYIQGAFVNVSDLLAEIKAGFETNQSTDVVQKYSQADVLILDDLGQQKATEWAIDTLGMIINNRYEHLRPIIITSNADLQYIAKWCGDDRMPSRISEMCQIVHFTNKDYRISQK